MSAACRRKQVADFKFIYFVYLFILFTVIKFVK